MRFSHTLYSILYDQVNQLPQQADMVHQYTVFVSLYFYCYLTSSLFSSVFHELSFLSKFYLKTGGELGCSCVGQLPLSNSEGVTTPNLPPLMVSPLSSLTSLHSISWICLVDTLHIFQTFLNFDNVQCLVLSGSFGKNGVVMHDVLSTLKKHHAASGFNDFVHRGMY